MKKITTLVLGGLLMVATTATIASCNQPNGDEPAETAPAKAQNKGEIGRASCRERVLGCV